MQYLRLSTLSLLFFFGLASIGSFAEEIADCAHVSVGENKRFESTALNLRTSPSRYGQVLLTLPAGEVVYQFRRYESWSQVNVASLNVTGFVATHYLSEDCIPGGGLTRKSLERLQVVSILIVNSLGSYNENCPCPYNVDRGGRSCGGRSAYARPGGRSPLCYPSDVTSAQIERFRSSR
jgi:hypothetical protein